MNLLAGAPTIQDGALRAWAVPVLDDKLPGELVALCDGASSRLIIVQYHFPVPRRPRPPMRRVLDALLRAADRGVRIDVLLNRPARRHRSGPSHKSLELHLRHQNIRIAHWTADQILHTKLCLAAPDRIIIGSHNLSTASFTTSLNISLALRSTSLYDRLYNLVAPLIARANYATRKDPGRAPRPLPPLPKDSRSSNPRALPGRDVP